MKTIILILSILALCISGYALEQQKIYFLSIEYDNGSLALLDIRTTEGFSSLDSNRTMSYRAELVSFDKKILYTGYFEIPNVIHIPPPIDQAESPDYISIEKVNFSISLPFDKKAVEMNIYDNENKGLLSINLSSFADYCGDERCSTTENADICPKDCVGGGKVNEIIFYLVIVAVMVIILLTILRAKKPKPRKPRLSK
jgi:hypothetical protein